MNDSNCPVQVPGFTHHGDCNLLCRPADWKAILTFFLGNYVAHAATVVAAPGQSPLTWAFSLVLALFFPGAGVLTGLNAILSLALLAPTELTRAARAGALCIVVEADGHRDAAEDEIEASRCQSSVSGRGTSTHISQENDSPSAEEAVEDESVALDSSPEEEHGRADVNEEARQRRPSEVATGTSRSDTRSGGESGQTRELSELNSQLRPAAMDQTGREDFQGTASHRQPPVAELEATLDGSTDETMPSPIAATQVHGIARLPAGYRLLVLPGWTAFEDDHGSDKEKPSALVSFPARLVARLSSPFRKQTRLNCSVPCSHNIVKALVSICQLLFSITTLYETRGNQITVFGYASFGLTVAPYFWMSLVNLLGTLMCPQYSTMFVVNSPTLDRLRKRVDASGLASRYPFDGTVGRISTETESRVLETRGYLLQSTTALQVFFNRMDVEKSPDTRLLICRALAAFVIAAVPIAIVGGFSRFDPGQSAAYQRVWTMVWLCLGPIVGVGYGMWILPVFESWPVLWRKMMVHRLDELSEEARVLGHCQVGETVNQGEWRDDAGALKVVIWTQISRFVLVAGSVCWYMAPAVGGLVVVGQMLMQYGTCAKMN